jgi:phosphoglycolate phosphatase-like HAD superfamily hydrolase
MSGFLRPLAQYGTLVFDCDGVILDSNQIKTEAFREVALPYGSEAAAALVKYHVENGGISRFRKFQYFLDEILLEAATPERVTALATKYGDCVYKGLLSCSVTPGLKELRQQTQGMGWMIVSGGADDELRRVFDQRGLAPLFDKGIFGSPSTKDEIFGRLLSSQMLNLPALFVGDSRYDHEASRRAGLDFVFASRWTEFSGWPAYCNQHEICGISAVADLLCEPIV